MAYLPTPAATRALSVMLCRCDAPPMLYQLPQSEQPLLEDVLPQIQGLLHSLDSKCSPESFGMDERFQLEVSDARAVFTVRAVLNLNQAQPGLLRNEYVSDMMSDIWSVDGADACSVYGTVVWIVSYLGEDTHKGDIDVVFNFDAPYVRSFKTLQREWKQGWASAKADGRRVAWSLRMLERMK